MRYKSAIRTENGRLPALRPAIIPDRNRTMKLPARLFASTLLASAVVALPAVAGDGFRSALPVVDLSAEASLPAANDLFVASLYLERDGRDPAALADEVNREIAAALATARERKSVKVQSDGTQTWPIHGTEDRRIEGWRMRSTIRLESRDAGAMSELVGVLQSRLAVGQIGMQPAPETRCAVADEAMVAAIRNFEARAGVIAGALGKRYRLRQLSMSEAGGVPVYARMRSAPAMMAEASPAPIEAGETLVNVSVSGSIELID